MREGNCIATVRFQAAVAGEHVRARTTRQTPHEESPPWAAVPGSMACSWHACPQHGTWPKASRDWWRAKLEQNVARDRDTDARLQAGG